MGSGILPETTVGNQSTVPSADANYSSIMQKGGHMWTWSRSAIMCCGPRLIYNGLLQSGNVFNGQTSPNLTFLLEIMDAVSSGLKRRETFQHIISVQFKSQHLWWCGGHKCLRYGQTACFGRHYELWKVYKGFRATYAGACAYFREGLVYFSRTIQNHIQQLLQQQGFVIEESRCWIDLPAVQIFHLQTTFGASLHKKYLKDDHKLFSSWKPISGKNGTKFHTKPQNSRNS